MARTRAGARTPVAPRRPPASAHEVPVDASGLTVDVVGAPNPAFGNQATNG
ncbi:chaplin family protein [Streptomyces collinus]|uniref:chaplin family protein n=1 Tax=Streptomyces collinus TaxID=42684 RepID=UPI0004267728